MYFLVLQSQSPQLGLYGSVYPLGAIRVRIGPPQEAQYGKILGLLSRGGPNTKKYSLVEEIENDCIVTRVGVYDKISPEPSGNPSGSALGISLGLRRYFIVYPSSRHNTVTVHAGIQYSSKIDCTGTKFMSKSINLHSQRFQ